MSNSPQNKLSVMTKLSTFIVYILMNLILKYTSITSDSIFLFHNSSINMHFNELTKISQNLVVQFIDFSNNPSQNKKKVNQ